MSLHKSTMWLLAVTTLVLLSNQAQALPTQVVHFDTPSCDTLFIPEHVDEIGDFTVFPADEALASMDIGQSPIAPCLPSNLSLPDFIVDIRNLSGRAWQEVWYVADAETTITNFDGEANGLPFSPLQEAFRIDNDISDPLGIHHPLISESMTPDGIWEIGESWQFVLQDYTNSMGLPPAALNSLGVGNASLGSAVGFDSSGSIIAVEVIPEPASAMLALMGLGGMFTTRRRR